MGKLSQKEEISLLQSGPRNHQLDEVSPQMTISDLRDYGNRMKSLTFSPLLYEYLAEILQFSRGLAHGHGLSPRAGLELVEASKGWAFLQGRDHVLPDDLQFIFPFVAGHRLYSHESLPVKMEHLKAREFIDSFPFIK
jgi:MoxR-like ATPase